jgi:16S rRNA (guanine527-N7)-methyltransferase
LDEAVGKRGIEELLAGSRTLGVDLSGEQAARLVELLDLLQVWNRKVNLTAITDFWEALEAHLLDSLAAAPLLVGANTVVDLGAGGGFPGLPLAVALPQMGITLVESVGKKVGFLKAAIAALGLANARAVQARVEGYPQREGVPLAEAAISRAFLPPEEWLQLAPHYVTPGGRVFTFLGAQTPMPERLPAGLKPAESREYLLPRSGARRRIEVILAGCSTWNTRP